MKRILFITTIAIGILSCNSQKDILYGKCAKHYYACTQILLKSAGEFEYFEFMDVVGANIIRGCWYKNNDTLVLNTYEQKEDRLAIVTELKVDTLQNNFIKFENVFYGFVQVDTSRQKLLPELKTLSFTGHPQTLTFHFYETNGDTSPVTYTVKQSTANFFSVKTRQLTSPLIFKNQKFLIEGRHLKSLQSSWSLKKTSMKHKQW